MSGLYNIWLTTPTGARLTPLDDFVELEYSRQVNAFTGLYLTVPYDALLWKYLQRDNRVEVWRSVDGGPDYLDTETVWFIRRRKKRFPEVGARSMEVAAFSAGYMLDSRIVPYYADTTQTAKITLALDDMMKQTVSENLGSSATDYASDTTRNISSYLSVELFRTAAPASNAAFAWEYLLPNLVQMADTSAQLGTNLFFDVVPAGSGLLEFRTYTKQRGMDRRATSALPLVVGPDDGSLVDVELVEDWSDERNYVYAGGQGGGSSRLIQTAFDTGRVNASPFNRREVFATAVRFTTVDGVLSEARSRLAAGRPRRTLTGRLQETPEKRYGVHWRWGDALTAVVDGEPFDVRADTVRVRVGRDKKEQISCYLRGE